MRATEGFLMTVFGGMLAAGYVWPQVGSRLWPQDFLQDHSINIT